MAADGETLYLVSTSRDGGLGACDIFKSERLDDTWKAWSKPVNLGSTVNTEASECFFSISHDYEYIYIDTHLPDVTDRDIKVVPFPDELKPRNYQAFVQKSRED